MKKDRGSKKYFTTVLLILRRLLYDNGSVYGTRVYTPIHFDGVYSSMAKVFQKKVSKKSLKMSSEGTDEVAAVRQDVDYDDDDVNLNEVDENITSEEEEDGGENERKRQKLLEAISALGGKRKKTLGERSEAGVQMS